MVQKQIQNVSEALRRAQELEEVFLVTLSREELQSVGFDTSTFGPFQFVDVYLESDGENFMLKYQFDGDVTQTYYEKPQQLGGEESFKEVVESYVRLALKKLQEGGE